MPLDLLIRFCPWLLDVYAAASGDWDGRRRGMTGEQLELFAARPAVPRKAETKRSKPKGTKEST